MRTEHELSRLYEDLIGQVPLGKQLFSSANPVRTGGPMQVEHRASPSSTRSDTAYPYPITTARSGTRCSRAAAACTSASPTCSATQRRYDRHLYRFADFNAGWYASRNAAFQAAVAAASGIDAGTGRRPDRPRGSDGQVGATEAAVRSLGPLLGHRRCGDPAARSSRATGRRSNGTELYDGVFALAERKSGRPLPRAVIPRIDLRSPKITRKLTTEWFANRVSAALPALRRQGGSRQTVIRDWPG